MDAHPLKSEIAVTNRNREIAQHLGTLRTLLMPHKCIAVRTDYRVTEAGVNRRCLVPEAHGRGSHYAFISTRDNVRPRGVHALVHSINIGVADADRVLNAAEALSELNDVGAWPLAIDDRRARVAHESGIESRPYQRLPGFEAAYQNVRDALPQIARVDLTSNTSDIGKKNSRKAWMHFYDHAGDQVAAIAVNLLATSIKGWFDDDDVERAKADRHLGRWANQLNADQSRFTEAAMDLLRFDSVIGATSINLQETC